MFNFSTNGNYLSKKNGLKITYTFPENAVFLVGDVSIPLNGLTVDSYGGSFDMITIQQMTNAVSSIKLKNSSIYNTDIFITSEQLKCIHYPSRNDFFSNNIPYMKHADFLQLQHAIKSDFSLDENQTKQHKEIVTFCKKLAAEKIKSVHKTINSILNNQDVFPKNISVIYDDRKLKHTTHILLEFINCNQYKLTIHNTLSPLYTFMSNEKRQEISAHIDLVKCDEEVCEDSLVLYENNKSLKWKVPKNLDTCFIDDIYNEMIQCLKKLEYEMLNVNIVHSTYNQKNTSECVPFSMQNKMEYVLGGEENYSEKFDLESVNRKRVRIRAEMVLILYLFSDKQSILRFDDEDAEERNVHYSSDDWYPNYPNVCNELDKKLSCLSLEDLTKIYSHYNKNEARLAPTFKEKIKALIMDKNTSFENKFTLFSGKEEKNEISSPNHNNLEFGQK